MTPPTQGAHAKHAVSRPTRKKRAAHRQVASRKSRKGLKDAETEADGSRVYVRTDVLALPKRRPAQGYSPVLESP